MTFLRLKRLILLSTIGTYCAFADQITFQLSTTGSFSSGTPGDLTFSGVGSAPPAGPAGFTGTTSGGALALTNLGTFQLVKPTHAADVYQNDTFNLNILFFLPNRVNGQATYAAALSGTVNTQLGSLVIDFGPAQHFTFSNLSGSGSFDLAINDLTLDIPHDGTQSVQKILTGSITNAVDPPITASTPEPLSIVLLGTVTLLVAIMARRRRLAGVLR